MKITCAWCNADISKYPYYYYDRHRDDQGKIISSLNFEITVCAKHDQYTRTALKWYQNNTLPADLSFSEAIKLLAVDPSWVP